VARARLSIIPIVSFLPLCLDARPSLR
jgi:hypothetical protein